MSETLAERVRVRGPRPWHEVLRIAQGVSRAVGQAHLRKQGHGAITPSSIVCLSGEGARALRVELVAPRPFLVPSLAFSGVEAIVGRAGPSPVRDVAAIGLVVFFALTGRGLWRSVDPLRGRLLDPVTLVDEMRAPPRASQRASDLPRVALPPAFDDWLAQCVAPDVSERFPTAPRATRALAAFATTRGLVRSGSCGRAASEWKSAR